MSKYLLARYIWEVTTIHRARRITLKEINKRWCDSPYYDGKDIPRRTWDYHRKEIEMLFGVNIECDKRDNTYHIEGDSLFGNNDLRQWLINTFSTTNTIREARDMEECISLENVPSAEPHLSTVIHAIRERKTLDMEYQSFERDSMKAYELEPYAVKLFRQRWYVIGKTKDKEGVLTFALDRILNLTKTNQKFDYPKQFNVHDYFHDSFGIIIEKGVVCQRVRIKVMNGQAKYFRSLPLHHSQKEAEIYPEYSIFEYWLKPTYDFEQELFSHREDIEVLEPAILRKMMKESIEKMLSIYKKK